MKCIIAFVILIGSFHTSESHSKSFDLKIPENIIQKLDSLFPDSKNIEWTKVRSTFRADFIYNDFAISITFNSDGTIKKYTEEINQELLPRTIKDRIEKDYTHYKILIILKKQRKSKCEYEVEVIKGENHRMLVFNQKGSQLFIYELIKEDLNSINY